MSKSKYKKDNRADQRRRSQRIVALRLEYDIFERGRTEYERRRGTVGMYERTMPTFDSTLLRAGRRVVDASVGAVALVGANLGATTWRHPRAYLGLFINPARRTS